MTENNIYYSENNDPEMEKAFQKARKTFKYFWRELSWEYRRIVPALDVAYIKAIFSEQIEKSSECIVEYMWIDEIEFDGDTIRGVLVNDPDELTNVKNGDSIQISLSQVSDWLFACRGKTYGGFTIQLIRSNMNEEELKAHDEAWGLDFGSFNDILLVYQQKEHPENLIEHPMSLNMRDKLIDFLKSNPNSITQQDEFGYTLLHRETIAGNKTSIEVLLQAGAKTNVKTNSGKTALDYAKELEWNHIIPLLEN